MGDLSFRKGKKTFVLEDAGGRVLKNTLVHVRQKNSEFYWGCGNFEALVYCNPTPDTDMAAYGQIMEKWLKLYNFATLPFYWGRFEREEGKPQTEKLLKTAKYLKSKGVTLKGHPLCWHTECTDWLLKYDNKTIMDKQLERIYREMTAFKGIIDMWDVINETVIMPVFDKYDNAITRICNAYGRINLIKEVFAAARAADPEARLLINDFNTSPAYEKVLDECLEAGVPIDVIGIQSHQHQGYWGEAHLRDILRRFSRFGIPIHFTENTLTSGHIMPPDIVDLNDYHVDRWDSEPAYEIRQRDEVEEMYRILFEEPMVKGIVQWDFRDDAWLHAPAGCLRVDLSEKPVYHMLYDMIHREFATETDYATDEQGRFTLEGFKGTYTVTTGKGECTATLGDAADAVETLRLGG